MDDHEVMIQEVRRYLRRIPFLLLTALPLIPAEILQAQDSPLLIGELVVNIHNSTGETIRVQADRVWGKKSQWYPEMTRWKNYTYTGSQWKGVHIDRGSMPSDVDTIGYARYKVWIQDIPNNVVYADFRDGEYPIGYANSDIFLHYDAPTDQWYRFDLWGNRINMENLDSVGVWQDSRKPSGIPFFPVTVRNSFQGGLVRVDGVEKSAPHKVLWSSATSHEIEAVSPQSYYGHTYYFISWSDAGAMDHWVQPTLYLFGTTYTAKMAEPAFAGEESMEAGNYPNPFNPVTKIKYRLQSCSPVHLTVMNSLGQQVAELVNASQEAGIYEVDFDGSTLASGVYYYTLIIGGERTDVRRMLLLK